MNDLNQTAAAPQQATPPVLSGTSELLGGLKVAGTALIVISGCTLPEHARPDALKTLMQQLGATLGAWDDTIRLIWMTPPWNGRIGPLSSVPLSSAAAVTARNGGQVNLETVRCDVFSPDESELGAWLLGCLPLMALSEETLVQVKGEHAALLQALRGPVRPAMDAPYLERPVQPEPTQEDQAAGEASDPGHPS